MKHKPLIRHTRSSDIKPLLDLRERVYPTIRPWPESTLRQQIEIFQIEIFPQGQIVAEVDGQLVGAASSLMILWDEWDVEHTWREITSRGSFDTHNPEGRTLYGAEVFVHAELRGAGIGHALYRGRRQICRKLKLKPSWIPIPTSRPPSAACTISRRAIRPSWPSWRGSTTTI